MFALNLENGYTDAQTSTAVLRSWALSAIKTNPDNPDCLKPVLQLMQHPSIRYGCAAFSPLHQSNTPVALFIRKGPDYSAYCSTDHRHRISALTVIEDNTLYIAFESNTGDITWYPLAFVFWETITVEPATTSAQTPLPEIFAPTISLADDFKVPLLLATQWGIKQTPLSLTTHSLSSIESIPVYLRDIPSAATLIFNCTFCSHEPSDVYNADNPRPPSEAPYLLTSSFSCTLPDHTPFQLRYSSFIEDTHAPNAVISQAFLKQLTHFLYSVWQFRTINNILQQHGFSPLRSTKRTPVYSNSSVWRMEEDYLWHWQAEEKDLQLHHLRDHTGNTKTVFNFPEHLNDNSGENHLSATSVSAPLSTLHAILNQLLQNSLSC